MCIRDRGRSEECYSEDPYLSARMAEAAVIGMQESGPEAVSYTHLDVYKRQVIVLCLSAFSGVLFFFIRNWVNDVQIQSQYRFQQKERQLENVQTWTRSYVEGL